MNHKQHMGDRTVRLETIPFLRQDPHLLAVLAEAASYDLQQYCCRTYLGANMLAHE